MDEPLHFLIVLGSVRSARLAGRMGLLLSAAVQKKGIRASIADPTELQLPLLDRMYKEYRPEEAPSALASLARSIKSADGVIVLSPEYNHGVPPALSNLLDHFLEEWFGKPCGIVTYSPGRFGGVRALTPLRAMAGEMGMVSISHAPAIPAADRAVSAEGEPQEQWIGGAIDAFLNELEFWAQAARRQRMAEEG